MRPAFAQIYRLLKGNSFCLSFYGLPKADVFISAWRAAGFRIAEHMVFKKQHASSVRFLRYHHEPPYLLAKGDPPRPACPLPDVLDWIYTGNRLHPTQKPVEVLKPVIRSFSRVGGVILDPFCGSGSTLVAAHETARDYIGMEIDKTYHALACQRLNHWPAAAA